MNDQIGSQRPLAKKTKYLRWVSDGPCTDHPCDNCAICRTGSCCRHDAPTYEIPTEGDWPGPIFGDIGKFERSDTYVTCHACGESFQRLPSHLTRHNLTAVEYKAIFGLNRRTPLWNLKLSAWQSRKSRGWLRPGTSLRFTPEQQAQFATKPVRRETRLQHTRDRTGQRLGRLTVLSQDLTYTKKGKTRWLCLCDCGNRTAVLITNFDKTSSCGCLRREKSREMMTARWAQRRINDSGN